MILRSYWEEWDELYIMFDMAREEELAKPLIWEYTDELCV